MVNYIKNPLKLKSTTVLALLSFFCLFLSVGRIIFTGKYVFLFLIWNLFLAFVPWFVSSLIYFLDNSKKNVIIVLLPFWLLFFPNAPYIVTDIIHLKPLSGALPWFDLILLFSYSFAGLFYGFVSLDLIEVKLKQIFNIKYPQIISVFVIYLSAFGIYLGRFLRWNSWDILTNFGAVLKDLFLPIANPFLYGNTWLFIFLLGSLFNLIYASYKNFKTE